MPSVRFIALISLCIAGFRGVADAADIECGLSQVGVVTVDGLLDDWSGVQGMNLSGGSPGDAAATLRCNYDEQALYLAVSVTDERLIRTKKAGSAEDHLSINFGGARLEIWPADTDKNIKASVRWSTGESAKHVTVVDSLQKDGWSVELAIPRDRLPGGGKNAVLIRFELEMHDADLAVDKKAQAVLTTGAGGVLAFEEAASMFRAFLEQNKLKRSELRLDTFANMDGEPGLERVVAGGKVIAVIGSEYSYIELPVQSPKDILEVRVVDLAGQGKASVIGRYVERGGNGSREVLAVWNLRNDNSFARTFAHEMAKQLGKNRLTNTWALVAPGKGKARKPKSKGSAQAGYQLVIKVGEVVGFTEESWQEMPASDMIPILVPWGEAHAEVWHFRDDEFSGGTE